VWSYEAGGKFRLFNGRMQLNSSVYRIDWQNIQQGVSLGGGCAPSPNWTQNAGSARSQGFDVEAQARLFPGFTANLALGYTHAVYSATTTAPKPLNGAAPIILLRKGDPLPVAPWQVSVGAEYAFDVGKTAAYVRGDVTYSSNFQNGPGPGLGGYAPDTYLLPSVTRVNVRAGVNIAGNDVNLFVNNLFNNDHPISKTGGRTSCSAATGAACTTYSNLDRFPTVDYGRPREIGVQVSRRF
jgi:outer membrane receptor protein involved in Fe transport